MKRFFLVGTGRSGTTLLQAMLSRLPGVAVPPETQFMEFAWRRRHRLRGRLADPDHRNLVEAMVGVLERNEFDISVDAFLERARRAPLTSRGIFDALLSCVGESTGATTVGEKSPSHTPFVFQLLAMFPEARVIHIVRDPRDVAVSQREAWGAPPLQAALRWRRDQLMSMEYQDFIAPESYRLVRYERLVSDPEAVTRELAGFLSIEWDRDSIHPETRDVTGFASRETHKARTLRPITDERVARWRNSLSTADAAIVDRVCRAPMLRLGYAPETRFGFTAGVRGLVQLGRLGVIHLKRRRQLNRDPLH